MFLCLCLQIVLGFLCFLHCYYRTVCVPDEISYRYFNPDAMRTQSNTQTRPVSGDGNSYQGRYRYPWWYPWLQSMSYPSYGRWYPPYGSLYPSYQGSYPTYGLAYTPYKGNHQYNGISNIISSSVAANGR